MALLLCQNDFFKRAPNNVILVVFFTLAWSVFVSSFTKDYNPQKVLICTALVASMTFGLSIIGFCLHDEMYWCFGLIATLIFSMIPMGFFFFAFPELWLTSLLGFLGTISVSVYIVLDTISILQRLGTDMYVIGSLYLYTDIIALFLYILALFGADNWTVYKVFTYMNLKCKKSGASRGLNPGPPAPKAGIIPLDHTPNSKLLSRRLPYLEPR